MGQYVNLTSTNVTENKIVLTIMTKHFVMVSHSLSLGNSEPRWSIVSCGIIDMLDDDHVV